jgi:Leucine-rich repeat (LRR) protein
MKMIIKLLAMTIVAVSVLVACNTSSGPLTPEDRAERAAEHEAAKLIEGEAAVEACRDTRCDRLDLDGTRLSDFTVLNDMTHVKALMVSRTNFENLVDIAGMSQLQELHISYTSIADLSGLSAFTNLDVLHMEGLREKPSLAPLATPALFGLVELALTTEKEDSITFLANMKSLKRLKFGYGEVGSLRPLDGHPSLEKLSSESDILSWQRGLLRIPRLKEFYVGGSMRNLDAGIRSTLEERGLLVDAPPIIVC